MVIWVVLSMLSVLFVGPTIFPDPLPPKVSPTAPSPQHLPLFTANEAHARHTQRLFDTALPEAKAFVRFVLDKVRNSTNCSISIELGRRFRRVRDDSEISEIYVPLLKGTQFGFWSTEWSTGQMEVDAIMRHLGYAFANVHVSTLVWYEYYSYDVLWC
jgi:hypothetical protein